LALNDKPAPRLGSTEEEVTERALQLLHEQIKLEGPQARALPLLFFFFFVFCCCCCCCCYCWCCWCWCCFCFFFFSPPPLPLPLLLPRLLLPRRRPAAPARGPSLVAQRREGPQARF
jgi:hypothetical protein